MTTEKTHSPQRNAANEPEKDGKPNPRQQQQLDEKRNAEDRQRQQNEGGK